MPAQRPYEIVGVEQPLGRDRTAHLGVRIVLGGRPVAGGDGGEGPLVGVARVDERLGLECGEGDGVGPQGGEVVGVELSGEHVPELAGRGLPVRVDERGLGLAGAELDPRLVQRPGPVHLDMGLGDRRPGPHAVEGHGEGEGAAGQVVARPGAGEVDLPRGESDLSEGLGEDGEQHFDFGEVRGVPAVLALPEGDDGHVRCVRRHSSSLYAS